MSNYREVIRIFDAIVLLYKYEDLQKEQIKKQESTLAGVLSVFQDSLWKIHDMTAPNVQGHWKPWFDYVDKLANEHDLPIEKSDDCVSDSSGFD